MNQAIIVSGWGKTTWLKRHAKGAVWLSGRDFKSHFTPFASDTKTIVIQDDNFLWQGHIKSLVSSEFIEIKRKGQMVDYNFPPKVYIETNYPEKWQGRRYNHIVVKGVPFLTRTIWRIKSWLN